MEKTNTLRVLELFGNDYSALREKLSLAISNTFQYGTPAREISFYFSLKDPAAIGLSEETRGRLAAIQRNSYARVVVSNAPNELSNDPRFLAWAKHLVERDVNHLYVQMIVDRHIKPLLQIATLYASSIAKLHEVLRLYGEDIEHTISESYLATLKEWYQNAERQLHLYTQEIEQVLPIDYSREEEPWMASALFCDLEPLPSMSRGSVQTT